MYADVSAAAWTTPTSTSPSPAHPVRVKKQAQIQRVLINFSNSIVFSFWVSYPVVLCPSNLEHMTMAKPSPKHAGNRTLVKLGGAIKTARKELGLSQEALAVDAEFDRSYMGGVERGEHNLTLMGLTKIAKALDVKPSDLLAQAGF
jgi:DNA-binding XRE family transcriptional regulator